MARLERYAGYVGVRGAVVLALIILVSLPAFAQLPTATILGNVKDSTGGAVAGATVTVTNTDTGASRTGPTMDDGSFRFPALLVGKYEVKVMKDGFQTLTRTGMTLNVGAEVNLDLALQVGSTSQSVVVTGEAPLVDTTSSASGSLVNEETVTDLPLNGRNWTDLTLLQPGVTQINALGSFSGATEPTGLGGLLYTTNGGTTRSNLILLDGADERTVIGFNNASASYTSLGVDGIKEYKVVSVLPGAEYGLVMGSQTTIVSKGGTNQWHGDGFDYLRNASLDANPYNVALDSSLHNATGPTACNGDTTQDLFAFPCKRIAPFQRNNFGGSVGGPIKKDKLFFFATYEGIQQRVGQDETQTTLPLACFDSTGHVPSVIANNGCVPGSGVVGQSITVNPTVLALAQFFPEPNTPPTLATKGFNYTQPYTVPTSESYGQVRGDYNLGANDSMFLRYTHDDAQQYPLNGADLRELLDVASSEIFTTLSETHIITPTLLNTFRFSVVRNVQRLFPEDQPSTTPGLPSYPANATTTFVTDISNLFGQPGSVSAGQIPQVEIPGGTGACAPAGIATAPSSCFTTYGSAGTPASYATPGSAIGNIYTISDDIFWTKGKHAFKFGMLVNRYDQYPWQVGFATGSATFPGANTPAQTSPTLCATANSCPLAAFFEGVYTSLSRAVPNSIWIRDFQHYTYGFYAADDYKVLPRVTLNLGIRYEFTTTPIEQNPAAAFTLRFPETDKTGTAGPLFTNPSLHNFAPRVGFAWDVFGNGKTSVRGGAGLYYDIATYGSLLISNSISVPNNVVGGAVSGGPITFTNPDIQNLAGQVCCNTTTTYRPGGTVPANTSNPSFPGGASQAQPFTVPLPSVANTAVVAPRTVDYNLQQPTLLQRSLGIEQTLPWGMALSVAYVGARDWHLFQEREGNPQAFYATMLPAMPAAGVPACNPDLMATNVITVSPGPPPVVGGNLVPGGCAGVAIGSGLEPLGPMGQMTYTVGGYTVTAGMPCSATNPCGTQPTTCPSAGCTAIANFNGGPALPFYCSPGDGTAGSPSAAHPCFNNATFIPCTSLLNSTTPACPGKINPAWNQVSDVTTSGDSYYNSLQVVLNKRAGHGLQFQLAYTWQKLLDTGSGQSTLENALQPHEFPTSGSGAGAHLDRQPASYDATHGIHFNFVYHPGDIVKSNGILGKLVNGWGLSAIQTFQSGYPLTPSISNDRTLYNAVFISERPDFCPGYNKANLKATATNTGNRATSQFFNPNAFCLPPSGTLGNVGGGIFTGPGIVTTNFSFTKDTAAKFLGESGSVEFRFEMFNAFNHMNFNSPTTGIFSASSSTYPAGGSIATLQALGPSGNNTLPAAANEVSSTAGNDSLGTIIQPRQMQVSLKIIF